MPTVAFTESPTGPALTVATARPVRLLDLCDEVRAPVAFGCRAARCTTCRVEILAGAALLAPPAAEESELLRRIHAPPRVRLACQALVRDAPGTLQIRWIGPLNA